METWFWILGWFLSILTITGNGFIIFLVCSKRQLRTKTNAFIVSLAVADFCVGMSVVPPMFFCEMANGCNPYSDWIYVVRLLFGSTSVTNLCCLVLDRFIAVVKPLSYMTFMTRRRVIVILSLAWGITAAYRFIDALHWFLFKIPILFNILFWITVLVFEFLPCLILIFCFASMLHIVCKHDRAARITARQLSFNHRVSFKTQEKSAFKIMIIVIGLFLLCYGFYIRCTFVRLFSNRQPCNDEQYKIPLLVLNSAINPVAYAFYKRDIKNEMKRHLFCAIVKRRNKVESVNEDNCFTLESKTTSKRFFSSWKQESVY
ncbi:hypothetical protein ACROYT_G004156 [Oculina patagonica]